MGTREPEMDVALAEMPMAVVVGDF
jgi:hypothetical protein